MPIPDQGEVKATIGDFEARIRHVVDQAWQEWLAFPNRARFVFLARARAILVFDSIARLALAEFQGDPHIHVIIKRQTVQFLFKGKVLIRFKKGNERGIGSNIKTQTVLSFIDPEGVIPGLVPEILKIEICYRPDDIGLKLDEVAVVARERHKRIWAYPLEGEKGAGVVPLPPRSPDETPPVVEPRQPQAGEDSKDQE